MENESLKPCLIYEWFWPDHFGAGETIQGKFGEEVEEGGEGF